MLNFKGWEKIAEDKSTTTLKHSKGHTMTLAHKKLPKIQQEALKRLKLAEGTDQGTVGDQAKAPPATNVTVNAAPPPQPQGSFQTAEPAPITVPEIPKVQEPVRPNGEFNPQAAAQNSQASTNLAAEVAKQKAVADVAYRDQAIKQQLAIGAQDQQQIKDLQGHVDAVAQNIRGGAIRPNAYLEDMGAGRKIGTAIGLLLGGGGAGLAGGSNPAEDFLNKQIDRNIDAQKNRLDQEKNIYGFYNDLYKNQTVASAMAKATLNNVLVHQTEMTAAKLGTAAAAAAAMDLKAKKSAENNKIYLESSGLLRSTPNAHGMGTESAPPQASGTPGPDGQSKPDGIMGSPSAEAMTPGKSKGLPPDDFADSPVLGQNAEDILNGRVKYGEPAARADYPKVLEQYAKAQQADRILGQLGPVFGQMDKLAKSGGSLGYIRRHDPFSAVPYVGTGIHKVVAEPATATPTNKLYDSLKTRITNDVLSALKGTEVGADQVKSAIDDNVPEPRDPPELVAQKERNIRLFIKNALNMSLLHTYKMTSGK